MEITESSNITLSIGLLVLLATVIASAVIHQQRVKQLEAEVAGLKVQLEKVLKKLGSLLNWRERIKGASSVHVPTAPLPPVQPPVNPVVYSPQSEGVPQPIRRDHTPIWEVHFQVHDTGVMPAYGDEGGELDDER